jgi:hypothetical protein
VTYFEQSQRSPANLQADPGAGTEPSGEIGFVGARHYQRDVTDRTIAISLKSADRMNQPVTRPSAQVLTFSPTVPLQPRQKARIDAIRRGLACKRRPLSHNRPPFSAWESSPKSLETTLAISAFTVVNLLCLVDNARHESDPAAPP